MPWAGAIQNRAAFRRHIRLRRRKDPLPVGRVRVSDVVRAHQEAHHRPLPQEACPTETGAQT